MVRTSSRIRRGSAVLRCFDSHWAKRKGYAILSHVWARDHSEKTYADIAALHAEGVTSYDDPRVGSKIRESVRVAKEQGYGWIWNDTCCIDKRSSSELDEAINSMFRWYAEAAVCFAYLQDVPDDCSLEETNSHFRRSIWFTRGWTLQELLAPHFLLFFSENWVCHGTKTGLASLVQEITGIEAEVLTLRRPLQDISVARRMSWASGRNTTKPEDRAYSLLGIFDVSMPTIYGEGSYAFRRLQVKIMKHHPDHTLFAWGDTWRPAGIDETGGPNKMHKSHTEPRPKSRNASSLLTPPLLDLDKSIFARSPSDFQHGAMTIISPSELIKRVKDIFDITIPSTTPVYEHAVTSSGVRCRFIIVHGKPFSLALLLCADDSQKCMALPLWAQAGDNHPQRYLTGVSIVGETYRLIPVCRATVAALNDLGWAARMDAKPASGSPKAGVSGAGHRNGATPRSGISTPGLLPTAATQIIYIANIHPSFAQSCTPVLEHEPRQVCIPSWLVTHLSIYQLELEDSPHLDTAIEAPSELHIIHQKTPQAPERKLAFTIHFSQCVGRLTALVTFPPDAHGAPATPAPAPR
ncbi:heterokaryon incompatibility protein-domain-containing protein, partial [Lenzites betulinus]